MNCDKDEIEIDLVKLFRYYLTKWMAFLLSGLGCALAAFIATYLFITPQYRSSVTVYVNNTTSTQAVDAILNSNLSTSQQLVNTYVNIIKSNTVLNEIIEEGELDYKPEELREITTARQIENTEMFTVTVSNPSPAMAAHIANTIAEIAPKRISEFVKGSSTEIIDYAVESEKPFTPDYRKNIVLGAFLGIFIMGVILTFCYFFNMRLKDESDIAAYLDVPLLGVIPEMDLKDGRETRGKFKEYTDKED